MAEPQHKRAPHTDFQILLFIASLCFVCAFLLSVIAYSLQNPQKEAKEFDQSKQMLIAAKILSYGGYFQIYENNTFIPAVFNAEQKVLVPVEKGNPPKATEEQIKEISELRIRPLLTDKEGNVSTFKERNITMSEYLEENRKAGYADLPEKLFYAILPNEPNAQEVTEADVAKDLSIAVQFVFPVSGFGLWGPIYGYLAVDSNGTKVIGTTWYEHAETPGLGANIAEPWWQKQFYNKSIFQESSSGKIDFQTADMGIIVVKGKVINVFGTSPKANSAVDGISGATLTGDGVTAAYKDSLTPYRELLIKIHKEEKSSG